MKKQNISGVTEMKMSNPGAELRAKREEAGLSCKLVGDAVARSHQSIWLYERGLRPVTAAVFSTISEAISRLSAYRTLERRQRDAFVSGLALPRYVRSKQRKKTSA